MKDYADEIATLRSRLDEAERYLAIAELRSRRPQLETELGRPDLWDDAESARKVQTEFAAVADDLDTYDDLVGRLDDAETLWQLGLEEDDDSIEAEVGENLAKVSARLDDLELRSLFTDPHDEF